MNKFIILGTLLISGSALALPHFDLEMTSHEYREQLALQAQQNKLKGFKFVEDAQIENSIKLGERLSKWIAKVNASRSAETAIRLTSPQTRRPVPIETPNIYNPKIIAEQLKKILAEMPEGMRTVLTSNVELPTSIGMEDETFIVNGRALDRNYQSAARYKMLNPYRTQYAQGAAQDVRGYYYLTKNKIGKEELKDTALIAADKVQPIKDALALICLNSRRLTIANCKKNVEKAFAENKLADFYSSYIPNAAKLWNDFFVIPASGVRRDVTWAESTMTVPFNTPSIAKFIPYLQDNIEDEFRWNGWGLKMNFGSFPNGPLLVFQPGVVPHVNGLGGNQIVMDSNQPIEEYESQWTIRHEFGHVLGLPDCYHEFYDTTLQAFVNYQLDIKDLMCSRAGNMTERIYLELKKSYQR